MTITIFLANSRIGNQLQGAVLILNAF